MNDRDPPKTKLKRLPGESIWDAMARELASNPDSPASLNIMSAVSQAMKPQTQAADQVVAALEAQLHEDGEPQRAALQAAIQYWERQCRMTMDGATLEDLQKTARERIERPSNCSNWARTVAIPSFASTSLPKPKLRLMIPHRRCQVPCRPSR